MQHRWATEKMYDDEHVLGMVSSSLPLELLYELYLDFVQDVKFLSTAPSPLVRAICGMVKPQYHMPGLCRV